MQADILPLIVFDAYKYLSLKDFLVFCLGIGPHNILGFAGADPASLLRGGGTKRKDTEQAGEAGPNQTGDAVDERGENAASGDGSSHGKW